MREQQLVPELTVFQRVEEVVAAELPGREAVQRFRVTDMTSERLDDEGHGCEALLTVNDQQRRLGGNLIETFFDVDNGANKVGGDLVVLAGAQNAVPELLASRFGP